MPLAVAKPVLTTALCAAAEAVAAGLGWTLTAALLPRIGGELSWSVLEGAIVLAALPLGLALAFPVGGALVERHGARWVGFAALLLCAVAGAARALAIDVAGMLVLQFLYGLALGVLSATIPRALHNHWHHRGLGRATGLAVLGFTVGSVATLGLADPLVRACGGWRGALGFASLGSLFVAGLWLALAQDRATAARHSGWADLVALAANPAVRKVVAMHALLYGVFLAMLGLAVSALAQVGLSPVDSGLTAAAWLGCAIFGNWLGATATRRLGLRKPVVVGALVLSSAGSAALALYPTASGLPALALAGLSGGVVAAVLPMLPLELPYLGAPKVGAAMGLLMLGGQLGGVVMTVLAGAALELGGVSWGLGVVAVAQVATLVPALRLAETGPRAFAGGGLLEFNDTQA
jgi:cyanate permease